MRKLHRWLGVVLLLPMLGWLLTALVFFIKPGYAGAYALLMPRTYALESVARVAAEPQWLEYRVLRTVLGEHVLARREDGLAARESEWPASPAAGGRRAAPPGGRCHAAGPGALRQHRECR